ncbi:MAG: diacylglycerol kinase [Gammaproteobacteria bacterium]|nr:diacylglycerol kinase [Gammaproteobacteria bacterium]
MNDHTPPARKHGFDHLLHATRWSWQGLAATIRHEAAFRQELFLFVLLAPLGWWLGETGIERALLIGSLWVVLIVEILNSALESTVNRIGTEHHELSGRAKDQGSAAVTLSLILVGIVWACVLLS